VRPELTFVSEAECSLIVEQALDVLETTGMNFGRAKALDELEAAGARVDRETGVACLPQELVERTVARLPRNVLLAGATPADDCLLEPGRIHFLPSGSPNVTLDFESGEYRQSTLEDVRRATIVADAMEPVDILWSLCGVTDAEPGRTLFRETITQVAWSPLHIQDEVTVPWQVEPMLALCETLCGGLEAYRERPRISYVCCTTSPLAVDGDLLDASIGVARAGGPIVVYPMPIAGATAPLTVAGVVTMNTAEFLGVATAIELAAPGSRQIMGVGTSLLDMHATTFSFGALETALMCATGVAVSHLLGVPALAPGLATDSKYGGIQAGYEKALKGLIVAQSGADLITGGIGLLSGAGIMSLPQIVIDAEMATMVRRLLDGAEITLETVQAEAIARRRFKGDYLKEKDTARRLRAGEVFVPEIASRLSLERWQTEGRDEAAAASARVRELIAAADARGPILPAETIAALDAITAAAEAAYAAGMAL
jgi:trimethylamine---corrinoid protein Co-methyltransferase